MILGTANILPPAQIVVSLAKVLTAINYPWRFTVASWRSPSASHLNRARWSFRMQRSITTKSPARRAFSAAFS